MSTSQQMLWWRFIKTIYRIKRADALYKKKENILMRS